VKTPGPVAEDLETNAYPAEMPENIFLTLCLDAIAFRMYNRGIHDGQNNS
jgi:hypothetical protein